MARSFLSLAVALAACSSGDSSTPSGTGTVATVAVSPGSFAVAVNDTLRFSAVARDAGGAVVSTAFSWGATGGSINSAGLFTAGASAAPASVWATAAGVADTSSGTVTATAVTIDTVWAQGFESGTLSSMWNDGYDAAKHAIVTDPARAQSGSRFLDVTYPANGDGGWLTRFFMPGFDTLYVSYWMKFETGWTGGTKLLLLWGGRTDNQWSASGTAGQCPTGTDFFTMSLLVAANPTPGPTTFYSYYVNMPKESDGVTCYGKDGGASYTPPLTLGIGTWHFVEYVAILNTPGQNNGRQIFWFDGVKRGDMTGHALRTSNILKLNAFTLSNSAAGVPTVRHQLIDNILIARQRPGGF